MFGLMIIAMLGITMDPMVNQVNQARTEAGLYQLQENEKLDRSAKNKACDLLKQNYWSHTDPQGHPFTWWISQVNYKYDSAGENLADSYPSDKAAFGAWMKSSGHRKNILSTKYTEIGVGRCGQFIVQHFGSPRTQKKTVVKPKLSWLPMFQSLI